MTKEKTDIVLFETKDKSISMPVEVKGETVWLSANRMALLFDRTKRPFENILIMFSMKMKLKKNTTRKKCVLWVRPN